MLLFHLFFFLAILFSNLLCSKFQSFAQSLTIKLATYQWHYTHSVYLNYRIESIIYAGIIVSIIRAGKHKA